MQNVVEDVRPFCDWLRFGKRRKVGISGDPDPIEGAGDGLRDRKFAAFPGNLFGEPTRARPCATSLAPNQKSKSDFFPKSTNNSSRPTFSRSTSGFEPSKQEKREKQLVEGKWWNRNSDCPPTLTARFHLVESSGLDRKQPSNEGDFLGPHAAFRLFVREGGALGNGPAIFLRDPPDWRKLAQRNRSTGRSEELPRNVGFSRDAVKRIAAGRGELKSLSLPRGFPPELAVKEHDEDTVRVFREDAPRLEAFSIALAPAAAGERNTGPAIALVAPVAKNKHRRTAINAAQTGGLACGASAMGNGVNEQKERGHGRCMEAGTLSRLVGKVQTAARKDKWRLPGLRSLHAVSSCRETKLN
ncbi:hypothetical protein WN51_06181 [Melipona quadrifasciata]|uniref:Uncharacterized protein n=1 Tax=Melipona quadrifasciata TaxID=166423 RepID=A0A0M8ZT62_9HYME|nr:hypothetical protein WN51_06181 [Melipona quadrifasciata]